MFSIEEQIKEIIRLSTLYSQNIRSLDDLRGIDRSLGMDFWDMRTRQYWLKNFGKDSLKNILNSTEHEALKRIVSVLYSGRSVVSTSDILEPADFYHQEKIGTWDKDRLIQKIMELTHYSRKNYFSEGLKLCHEKGISLDELVL